MDATLFDVQDLCTLRGGSRALLLAPDVAMAALPPDAAEPVFTGASQALFRLKTGDRAAAEKIAATVRSALAAPGRKGSVAEALRRMRVVVDVEAADGDEALAIERVTALNRFQQYQSLTVPLPPLPDPGADTGKLPCPLDRVRPGVEKDHPPGGGKERYLSSSVAARRAHGRRARQSLYGEEMRELLKDGEEAADTTVTDDFRDIVAGPPSHLPESLHNKLAVLYFDGNRFGKVRGEMAAADPGGMPKALARFSATLKARRAELLGDVLQFLADKGRSDQGAKAVFQDAGPRRAETRRRLRLETLLWGGDEMTWVVPAWLAWDVLGRVFRTTADWKIELREDGGEFPGRRLTHAAGVVIAHYKTPIRQCRAGRGAGKHRHSRRSA